MDNPLRDAEVDQLAAAVRARLGGDRVCQVRTHPEHGVVEVTTPDRLGGAVVLAAVTADAGSCAVVRYAHHRARALGVRLRVAHVWSRRSAAATDLLLSSVLLDCLEQADVAAAEREILHDPDTVRALRALSHEARLLVVSSASEVTGPRLLGDTAAALIGRTACPLAIVLPPVTVPSAPWWSTSAPDSLR